MQPSAQLGMGLQNPYCVRCTVDGLMVARQSAMVAHRGDLTTRTKDQGLRKLVKRAATGEGVALMDVEGHGDIWLADLAKKMFQLQLEGEGSVIVQPSEGPPPLPKSKGVADAIGDLLT